MELSYLVHLSGNAKEFIQSKNYEETVLDYITRSTIFFPGSYRHIPPKEQNSGQPDYIDNDTNEKYDVKLLFSEEQCAALAKGSDHYIRWHDKIMNEINEVTDCLRFNPTGIEGCKLYNEVKKRISATGPDENVILFLPFPMDLANEPNASAIVRFASGVLSYAIDSVIEDLKLPESKHIYSITPTLYQGLVAIREYPGYAIPEHLPAGDLLNYFRYEVRLSTNNEA